MIPLFGSSPNRETVLKNVRKALDASDFKYDVHEDGSIALGAMGDDLPIGMVIDADDKNRTLNIYCYLMFKVDDDNQERTVMELNRLNNTINNGGFYLTTDGMQIYFKIVQSYFDRAPSPELIQHLMMVAFSTVDNNDGHLKEVLPENMVNQDHMYS